MASNKIHFVVALLSIAGVDTRSLRPDEAAVLITNDSMRCWSGPREYSHFTVNPVTGEISWIKFPNVSVNMWR